MNSTSVSPSSVISTPVALCIWAGFTPVIIFGVLGNAQLLRFVWNASKLDSPATLLMVSVNAVDLLKALVSPAYIKVLINSNWPLPEFLCPILPFNYGMWEFIMCWSFAAIAVHRWRSVIQLMSVPWSRRFVFGLLALIWVLAVVFASPYLFFFKVTASEIGSKVALAHCIDKTIGVPLMTLFDLAYFVLYPGAPLLLAVACYVHVIYHLWTYTPLSRDTTGFLRSSRNAIFLSLLVLLAFMVMCLPLTALNFAHANFDQVAQWQGIDLAYLLCHFLTIFHSCANVILYYVIQPDFRECLQRLWKCRRHTVSE